MQIILDNRIRTRTSDIPIPILRKIQEEFNYKNPEFYKRKAMGYYTGNTPRIISTWTMEARGEWFTLPRGAWYRFMDLLAEVGLVPNIDDRRYAGPPVKYDLDPNFQWRDYQLEAIDLIQKYETCLIQGGPASGKSEILLGAILNAELRAGIMVHDKKLFRQWVDRIERRFGIPNRKIGKVGGGYEFKLGNEITVMMQQTAKKRIDDLYDKFGFIGQDECHHASAPTFLETLDQFNARYKVGVTATIKRQDLRHFLIHDQFGEVAFSIDRQELVDRGFTTDVELIIVPTHFYIDYLCEDTLNDLCSRGIIEDLKEFKHAEKVSIIRDLDIEWIGYPNYLNSIAIDIDRNNLIYRVVNHEYKQGSRIVIFTKRRHQCELFRRNLRKVGIDVVIFWGSKGKAEDDRMDNDIERIKSGQVRVAIGNVLDEGLDFPTVDVGVITYRNANNPGQLDQQAGRLARLFKGKDRSRLYYLHDGRISKFKGDISVLKKRFRTVTIQAFPQRVRKIVATNTNNTAK